MMIAMILTNPVAIQLLLKGAARVSVRLVHSTKPIHVRPKHRSLWFGEFYPLKVFMKSIMQFENKQRSKVKYKVILFALYHFLR